MNYQRLIWIREKGSNLVLFVWYALFAAAHLASVVHEGRLASLPLLAYETLVAMYILLRAMPKHVSSNYYDWFIGFAGFLAPLLLRPVSEAHDVLVLQVVQIAGISISVAGLLALNTSLGIVAANRGIKKGGIYRWIRHPLYTGYLVMTAGFVLQNISTANVIVFVLCVLLSVLRIRAEEKFLAQDETYRAYMLHTPWRAIPLVW